MTPVVWLIQTNLLGPGQISTVWDEASVVAECVSATVRPFVEEILLDKPIHSKAVIPYGSTKLTKLAQEGDWLGVFFDKREFRNDVWNANRDDMLNADAKFMTALDTQTYFKDHPDDDLYFIRPMEDLKAFAGAVTTVKEIRNWMDSAESGNFSFNPDVEVSIARPKNIKAEWRWFIVDGKVVDGSLYRWGGQRLTKHEEDPAVIAEAQELANKWLPNQCCVMDTALTSDGLKVVEFNCINSSGFYDHNIKKIVVALTEYVRTL